MIQTEKKQQFKVQTEDLVIDEFMYESERNDAWYMRIETLVKTHAGLLIGRKIREFWTNPDIELINGKNRIYESATIIKDDIGYFM